MLAKARVESLAGARDKIDEIEAAVLAREDIEAIKEEVPEGRGQMADLEWKDLIRAMSLPQLERLLASLPEEEAEVIPMIA